MENKPADHASVATNLIKGSAVIILVSVVSKLTAFLAEAMLAAYLGTTSQSDAYYMVLGLHQVLFPMLIVGIWKVFLPIYKEKLTLGMTREADAVTNKSLTFFSLIGILLVLILVLFADPVSRLIAPGFDAETRKLYVILVRISSPMYVFILAAGVYSAILQCHNRFFGSQIREIASHIPTIVFLLLFYRTYGVKVLALATMLGGLLRLLVELPFVNWGYRFRPDFRFRGPDFSLLLHRLPASLLSEGVTQLNVFVDKAMASLLPTGTISGLNYGQRLINVFSGLLSTAVSTALYPQMVELAAQKKTDMLGRLVERIIRLFSVMMIPISLACILFRRELVSVVFERGSFDAGSAALTSGIFACYGFGIFFTACNQVLTNLFYGSGDTKTPLAISAANLVMNVVLNLILIRLWGANGLALATSLSAAFSFAILFIASRKRIQMNQLSVLVTSAKSLAAACAAVFLSRLLFDRFPMRHSLVLLCSALISVPVYLAALKLLRVSELGDIFGLVRKLFRRKKKNAAAE